MCGIAGIISLDGSARVEAEQLSRMTRCLTHRGPDDEGAYISADRTVGLGFRRLAVIDLERGNQPIANEDGSIRAVCNGEIYNYQALRDRLGRAGHRFSTAGDIEPIVHLYEDMGVGFLGELDGFWGLALVDNSRQKMLLAVDRFGKKPIYYSYSQVAGMLYFASELKALTELGLAGSLDRSSLIDYLRFGWIPAPKTVYGNISKLQPGECLQIRLGPKQAIATGVISPVSAYQIPFGEFVGSYRQARRQVRSLLSEAVSKRLAADVPVGVLLSGGLDSAIVTALAAETSEKPVKTFTVGFEDDLYDERPAAALIAERFKTDHTELMVRANLQDMLELVGSIFDEPFADSSAIPTYLVCREAAKHVKVVLTGDGGDEAFLGYDRYRAVALTSMLTRLGARPFGKLVEKFIPRPGPELRSRLTRFWRLMRALRFTPGRQYSMFLRVFYERQLENVLGPELQSRRLREPDWIAQTVDACTGEKSIVKQSNRADYLMYLPYDLLVKVDRSSMANGLETRSPFLDRRLVEFATSLPVRWRSSVLRGKRILRDAFRQMLPAQTLSAGKAGFGVPMGRWLRGPLQGQMEDVLGRKCRIVTTGLVDNVGLVRLQAEHAAGMFDHSQRLWALMVLEQFCRRVDSK